MEDKGYEFYRQFYEENRVALLQYRSLRKYFNRMVTTVLGADYYNTAMDVYEADKICCEDITRKAKLTVWQRLFGA
ncbi:hypothetical protein [Salinisphaera sp. G21_0]|uniref:hypothetical protein n=1 Tax=Salinisphaera sp. G21_0 TaxID=2821094 RepID=UPI001ADBF220|nr:hypothetical protein [Salinisphaera sp. G21_0]MBO9483777.1 hypothetical protein [Salinisphaera sp. G21_0]